MKLHDVDLAPAAICEFCRKWKVKELSLFGSILRDDFRPDSDVDFLYVRDVDDEDWDVLDYMEMIQELEQIVGRKVDLLSREVVESDHNWLFRRSVLSKTENLYAA
jgi:hypothetical protein